jgi:hypothetical protein
MKTNVKVVANFDKAYDKINISEEFGQGVPITYCPAYTLDDVKKKEHYLEAIGKILDQEFGPRRKELIKKDRESNEGDCKHTHIEHIHEDSDDLYPMPCESDYDEDIEVDDDEEQ